MRGFQNVECKGFEAIILDTLNRYAPLMKRYIRGNNAPFMTKELCKAIMVRSRLHNKSLNLKTIESREAYRKQRNYCVALLRESKKYFCENLDINLVTDNIKFWKLVKPFFTGKKSTNTKITLIEGNAIISDAAECAEIMNNFFSGVAINLEVDRNIHTEATNASNPVTLAIEKYNNHPSIIKLN